MSKGPVMRQGPKTGGQDPFSLVSYLMMLQVGSRRVTVGSWV